MSLDHAQAIGKRQTTTEDAFLGGRLTISQPLKGFRAGLDSVLLGAAVGHGSANLLDLGAGVGTAALVALANHPAISATLVEVDREAAALAEVNVGANGFAAQGRVVVLDVTAPGRARAAAGLAPDAFETVIANPPFFESGTVPAPLRARARHMQEADIEAWIKAAASHAAPAGEAIFISPAHRLSALLAAFESRFGGITVLPLTPREGEAAHRLLIRGVKGSRAPLTLLASRPLHTPAGRAFRPEFEAIFRGRDRLHW
jgi:tRNA1(Val) A37 N6-methylase TrmN6